MSDNTHEWLYGKSALSSELESPSPHLLSPQLDDGNISMPPDQHTDLATTLTNIANTYEYLKGLGFSDEALAPLVTTYDYLRHQEASECPETGCLMREVHTKPHIINTSQDPDLQETRFDEDLWQTLPLSETQC